MSKRGAYVSEVLFPPSFEEQANEEGYTLGDEADLLESARNALYRIQFYGIFTERELENAFNRLLKKLKKQLKPLEEDQE